tara:strand:+ start:1304 stop:4045 length:2742 start_codon:yes stop_codon:yes gene_type:complete
MATLTGKTIASTYKDLLQISNSNSGVDSTLRVVSDGEATDTVLYLSSAAAQITSDAKLYFRDTGLYIASNADGDLDIVSDGTAIDSINIESAGGITLDAGTAGSGIAYEDDGDEMLRIHHSSSDVIFQIKNDSKDLVVQQYDGYEVVRFSDTRGRMYFYDEGGEYIQSDGTDLTLASGADIALTATNDVNIPANVGLTFGHASNQKIEGDGTDLAIDATGNINITSTVNEAASIYLRANAGTSETIKIHSDQGTSVTEGAESVTILSDAGGVGIRSTANLANAVNITADGGTTSSIQIFNDQGTSVTEGSSSIEVLSDAGGVELKSTANLAKSIKLIADGGTSETVYIQSDQGTGADSIELLSDAGGITISAGNTSHGVKVGTVSGAPVTIGHTTSETTVADNLSVTGNAAVTGTVTVGSDGSGTDVIFYSGTAGDNLTWDASEEVLNITGTNGQTSLDVLDGDVRIVDKLYFYDRGGEYMSSDGSTLTVAGALTLSGAVSMSTTLAVTGVISPTTHIDMPDSANIKLGTGDDMQLYHDGSNSYITNSTGALKIATETSGIAITIGHGTSEVTIADNLTVTGDLTVSGDTVTMNTATLTVEDSLIKLAQGYTGSAYDQGIVFTRGNGSSSNTQNMAFIWDESADTFATIQSSTEDGTTAGNMTVTDHVDLRVGALTADDSSTFTSGFVVGSDGSGADVIFYSGTSGDNMTWDASEECLTITGTDGQQALKIADGDLVVVDKLYIYDNDGGEYISGDGSTATLTGAWASANMTITGGAISGITDLAVADGGTGASTLTDGGILLGSGTGAITAMSVLGDGVIVVGDNSTDPTTITAFTANDGYLKHEVGGIEADISSIAKGGLVVGTGTGSMGVKAVGTNDYLLTADSSATGGVKWAENSAATKGFAVAMAVAL